MNFKGPELVSLANRTEESPVLYVITPSFGETRHCLDRAGIAETQAKMANHGMTPDFCSREEMLHSSDMY
jgi:hypothetical protein